MAASLSSSVNSSEAIFWAVLPVVTVEAGVEEDAGLLCEFRIHTIELTAWGLVIQVRPSFVWVNRWMLAACAGLITANVDISDTKIEELDSKLSISFLFMGFLDFPEQILLTAKIISLPVTGQDRFYQEYQDLFIFFELKKLFWSHIKLNKCRIILFKFLIKVILVLRFYLGIA